MYGKNVQGVEMHFAKGNTSNFVLKRSLKKKKKGRESIGQNLNI